MAMPDKALRRLRIIAAQGAAKDFSKPKASAADMAAEGDDVQEADEVTCPKCGHEGPLEEFQAGADDAGDEPAADDGEDAA